MKKKKTKQSIQTEPPQQALEKILKTEIKIAQKISEAKDLAEKTVVKARDEVAGLKESIIEEAREERESIIASGVEEANRQAQEAVKKAEETSAHFLETSKKFIDEAVSDVIAVVLEKKDISK